MELIYTDKGKGKVIVLLHGFCENRTLWNNHQEALSKYYRVITIDLPGFGDSPSFTGDMNIEAMTSEVHNVLKSIDVEQSVMVGHSLGGYIALAYSEMYPKHTLGLCMFHSTAFADNEERKKNRDKSIEFIQENGVAVFAQNFVAPLFNPLTREDYTKEIKSLIKIASSTNERIAIAVIKAMRNRRMRITLLRKLTIPVMYIVGKNDTVISTEAIFQQCHLPQDSQVHIYEHTGHMAMIERKKETIFAIKQFTEKCVENI